MPIGTRHLVFGSMMLGTREVQYMTDAQCKQLALSIWNDDRHACTSLVGVIRLKLVHS